MSVKNILMLVGEFSEEYEIFVFQQTFEALGHSVDIVCPETKAGYRLTTSVHDFGPDLMTWSEHRGHAIEISKDFDAVDTADYDAVYVAGGRGPEIIRTFPRIREILREFHRDEKPIASICHGLQVLAAVPDSAAVWPGHDYGPVPSSTMGNERRSNYVLEPRSVEEFVAFMAEP